MLETIKHTWLIDTNTKKPVQGRFNNENEQPDKDFFIWCDELHDYYKQNQSVQNRPLHIGGRRTTLLSIGRGNKRKTKLYTQLN